ncbi:MAG: SMC family ATPase [Thermoplasmata archaeon]
MQLVRVEVRNIRSYARARLDLEGGTTLLVGDVGSGKTSLLYAIEMALFGTAEIDATYLVRHGATEATVLVALEEGGHRYEIERAFRRVRRKGREMLEPGRLSFRQDGATTSYSATELRAEVIKLLGFRDNPNPRAHSDLWRWAVYVPQERMREILAAEPLVRLETVRKALGVERYRIAAENAKEVARDVRRTSTTLRAQASTLREYSEDLEPAVAEVHRLEQERERVEASLATVDRDLGVARERARAAELRVQEFASARQRLADLARDAAREREAVEEAGRRRTARSQEVARGTTDLEALTALAADEGSRRDAAREGDRAVATRRSELELASAAEVRLSTARELEAARGADVGRARADRDRTRAEVARTEEVARQTSPERLPSPVAPTPLSRDEIDVELKVRRAAEQSAGESLAMARRTLEELHELTEGGVCPRCHQSVRAEQFTQHETEAREALAGAERNAVSSVAERRRWEELRVAREAYEGEEARREVVVGQHRDALAAEEQADHELLRTEARLTEATDAWGIARAAVEPLIAPAAGVLGARTALESAEEVAERARSRYEESRRATERRSELGERLRLLEEEGRREVHDLGAIQRRQEERAGEVEELNRRLSTEPEARREGSAAQTVLVAREADRHRIAEERGRLAGLTDAARVRQRRAEAARIERDRLNQLAERVDSKAEWLTHAFHDAVLTMERRVLEHAQSDFEQTFRAYFAVLVDDPDLVAVTDSTFSPAAEIRGVETPAEALSGGERTSLALAYRLALSRVVRSLGSLRFDALLLDEPTDGFSPEQVQSMGQLLEELRLPQVILVSHERELEAIADRVVRVEKEDGASVLHGPGTRAARADPTPPT